MQILKEKYVSKYKQALSFDLSKKWKEFNQESAHRAEPDFEYLMEASAVYSSNIEGNPMDLNSFMNSKLRGVEATQQTKEFQEIVDLKQAYGFAQSNTLSEENLLQSHKILSKLFVSKGNQGRYRQDSVGVYSSQGLVYLAVEANKVPEEMKKLFDDINYLLQEKMSVAEIFYWASFIHLQIELIHPFVDGNGRVGRLAEKWFLSQKLGKTVWLLESEKYYKENIKNYYQNINLGVNYYESDYDQALPFLLMLPEALKND